MKLCIHESYGSYAKSCINESKERVIHEAVSQRVIYDCCVV